MKVRSKSPNSKLIIKRFSLLLVVIAGITAVWAFKTMFPTVTKSSFIVELQPGKFSPQLYWLEVVNNRIKLTPKTISTVATSPEFALKEALNELLEQSPNLKPTTTTIPQQTRLLDLRITNNDIYINLSQEFSQGGGSSSMIYRVAQVLYTATSINPQASVFLSIEGQPLNKDYPLGGEGLLLEYPLTRQKFTRDFLFDLHSYSN